MRFSHLLRIALTSLPLWSQALPANLLRDPGFEAVDSKTAGWVLRLEGMDAAGSRDLSVHHGGLSSGKLHASRLDMPLWPSFEQAFRAPFQAGSFAAEGFVRLESEEPKMDLAIAYLAFEFYDKAGTRTGVAQGAPTRDTHGDWSRIRARATIPEGTALFKLKLILHGAGSAWFDDITLVLLSDPFDAMAPAPGETGIEVAPNQGLGRIEGFGAEVDPWLFNQENRSKGVGEEDIKLVSSRIKDMGLSLARVFIWWKAWNPSGDLKTFEWDSDEMVSLYKTLTMLQERGASVIVCGTEWQQKPYDHPKEAARAMATLMEHLLIAKRFSCIKYWTLSNEPYNHWYRNHYSFASYVKIHRDVVSHFIRLGIRGRIRIVGADEGSNLTWFQNVARELHDIVDAYSIHIYFRKEEVGYLAGIVQERRSALLRLDPQAQAKPLLITELGVIDQHTTDHRNKYMQTFDCALRVAWLATDALNLGINGCSVWTLSKIYYPGFSFMDYGLWEYKDTGWKIRPVFHTFSLFTRFCPPGAQILKTSTQDPKGALRAASVRHGSTITVFLVNPSPFPVPVRLRLKEALGDATRYLVSDQSFQLGHAQPSVARIPLKSGAFRETLPGRSVMAYRIPVPQP